MKKAFLLFFVILLFTSCYDFTKNHTLVEVDNMMNSNPDSAYSILKQVAKDTASFSTSNKMYFKLLQAEAMNKKMIPMASITDMDKVLKYYTENGNENELTQANYMMGSVYRDRGNNSKAILYYNRAVHVPDTTKKDCNFRLVSRIYGQLAEIYMLQRYLPMEIHMRNIEASLALKAKDTINYLGSKERMGHIYYQKGEYEKVKEICLKSYSLYKKIGRKDLAAAGLIPLADYYLRKQQPTKAKALIDEYRLKSQLIDKKGKPLTPETEYTYYYLGWCYKDLGKTDSALYCYRKLLNYPNDLIDIEGGYEGLMQTYQRLGNVDSVKKYSKLYIHTNEKASVQLSSQKVSRTQALYDYTYHQQQATKVAAEHDKLLIMLFLTIATFFALAVSVYFWRKKNLKEMLELLLQNQKKEEELSSVKKEAKKKEQALNKENAYLKDVIKTYQQINWEEDVASKKQLMESDIVKKFLNYQKTRFTPFAKDWAQLETALKKFLPTFYEKLVEKKLTDKQFRLCLLTKINCTPSDIANLFGAKIQQISNLRRNVNSKLFNQKGTATFEMNVKKL